MLLDVGTCGLHIVHNAFQHGEKASNWNVKKKLSAMWKIFPKVSRGEQTLRSLPLQQKHIFLFFSAQID